ncbi:MAG: RNA methyltransferase, partial [Clostridia bacterium]|nr:RNA methyltransferase [Clostridia bacterium]
MERITAPANDKIKYAVRLAAQPAFRRAERAFFLEGARLCADAAASGLPLLQVFLTAEAAEKYAAYLAPVLASAAQAYEIGDAPARR